MENQLTQAFDLSTVIENETFMEAVLNMRDTLSSLLENVKKMNEKKNKPVVKKDKETKENKETKNVKVYTLDVLHKPFLTKHNITESITDKQLESYLQFYFNVLSDDMKPLQDDSKTTLNLPEKDFSIIEEAFRTNKLNMVPKKDDVKYFMSLLEHKKTTVDFNDVTYSLLNTKDLLSNAELFTKSYFGKNKKVFYTLNKDFGEMLKENKVLSKSFDLNKQYTESKMIDLFDKYNDTNQQLYCQIDPAKTEVLDIIGVPESDYIVDDLVYIKPKVLKAHVNRCHDGNTLNDEVKEQLKEYGVTSVSALNNFLNTLPYYED